MVLTTSLLSPVPDAPDAPPGDDASLEVALVSSVDVDALAELADDASLLDVLVLESLATAVICGGGGGGGMPAASEDVAASLVEEPDEDTSKTGGGGGGMAAPVVCSEVPGAVASPADLSGDELGEVSGDGGGGIMASVVPPICS